MFGSGKKYPCVRHPKTGKPKYSKKGKSIRSFKVASVNGKNVNTNARFVSATPAQSASKAFSSWCRSQNKGGRCSTTIRVTETTRGSKAKTYGYNASRSWNKQQVDLGGKKLSFKFANKLHSQKQRVSSKTKKNKQIKKKSTKK